MKNKELAAAVGVSANTVTSWVTGATLPDLDHLRSIGRALDLSVGILVGEDRELSEAEELVSRIAGLHFQQVVREFSASAPDLMAVLSEAERQERAIRGIGPNSAP